MNIHRTSGEVPWDTSDEFTGRQRKATMGLRGFHVDVRQVSEVVFKEFSGEINVM